MPNVLITGTPGCGKTTMAKLLVQNVKKHLGITLKHLDVSKLIKENRLYEEYDKELDTYVIHDQEVEGFLENEVDGDDFILFDFHSPGLIDPSTVDLVILLRCNNTVLYDRLLGRNYPEAKIQENIDAEIMQVVKEELYDMYDSDDVIELNNETEDHMASNLSRVMSWLETALQE